MLFYDCLCKVLARLRATPLLTTQCDLLQQQILPQVDLVSKPTVLVVKLCLEFAADSPHQVRHIIKRLADMIGETSFYLLFPSMK